LRPFVTATAKNLKILNVDKHVNRLAAIVDDLISLSKIEQDDEKKEIKLQKSPIRNVLQTAIGNCREKAKLKEITIDIACEQDISAMIDTRLLEQAVFNLLDNAINYSEQQSSVQVSVAVQDSEIIISVQDHGLGISKEHHSRLFERFYRADKARNRKLGGTGLGLAIVKHIAQAHGGRVSVESAIGKGSTFSFYLPKE
jgi:two-component system phosphate regulon sensor histidine kinase PhoR